LIIFQWGIWILGYAQVVTGWHPLDYLPMRNLNKITLDPSGSTSYALIIFQWGIWIWQTLEHCVRHMHLIIFQWGIWIAIDEISGKIDEITWLSSNEEFESMSKLAASMRNAGLIIFQWGIWICGWYEWKNGRYCLDYLPMRNLNIAWSEEDDTTGELDYLPMRNLNHR